MKWILLFLLSLLTLSGYSPELSPEQIENYTQRFLEELERKRLAEEFRLHQERLLMAIIRLESAGQSNAYNRSEDAVGILQIRRCYVREVNEICQKVPGLSHKKFTYEDRWDIDKSIEMFYILNDYHVPSYHKDTVMHVHNGGAYDVDDRWKYTKNYRKIVNGYFDENKEIVNFNLRKEA